MEKDELQREIKKECIVQWPEYIPKRTLSPEQIERNKEQDREYAEIRERREEQKLREHLEFLYKQRSFKPAKDRELEPEKAVPSSFNVRCLSKDLIRIIGTKFISSHPIIEDGYPEVPIFININNKDWRNEKEPFIYGCLQGFYTSGANNKLYMKIIPFVTKVTLGWIKRVHHGFKTKISEYGELYIDCNRIWDDRIPHEQNPVTKEYFTEVDSVEIRRLLDKYDSICEEIKKINRNIKYSSKHNDDVSGYKEILHSLLIQSDLVNEQIDQFYKLHSMSIYDDKWTLNWTYIHKMRPLVWEIINTL